MKLDKWTIRAIIINDFLKMVCPDRLHYYRKSIEYAYRRLNNENR